MVHRTDGRGAGGLHVGDHVLQIEEKIVPQGGVASGGGDVLVSACKDNAGCLLEGVRAVGCQCAFQILCGIFEMPVDVVGCAGELGPFGDPLGLEMLSTLSW